MTNKEIENSCNIIIGELHTLDDCKAGFDKFGMLLKTGISEYGFALIKKCTKTIIEVRDRMIEIGEPKFNYRLMVHKLNDELIPKKRIEIISKTEEVFSDKFPKSMYGHLIIELLKEEKGKLN